MDKDLNLSLEYRERGMFRWPLKPVLAEVRLENIAHRVMSSMGLGRSDAPEPAYVTKRKAPAERWKPTGLSRG